MWGSKECWLSVTRTGHPLLRLMRGTSGARPGSSRDIRYRHSSQGLSCRWTTPHHHTNLQVNISQFSINQSFFSSLSLCSFPSLILSSLTRIKFDSYPPLLNFNSFHLTQSRLVPTGKHSPLTISQHLFICYLIIYN
jgi:hypothetical protein